MTKRDPIVSRATEEGRVFWTILWAMWFCGIRFVEEPKP